KDFLRRRGTKMKVAKFGGSSVADAAMLTKVSDIITSDPLRKFIVVSAPGKRFKEDIKVTDLFIELGKKFFNGEPIGEVKQKILDRFGLIIKDLKISTNLLDEIHHSIEDTLYNERYKRNRLDALKAMGEDTLAKILSAYLQSQGVQASYVNPKEAGIMVRSEEHTSELQSRENL